jgi:hypothetical protein
VVRLNNFSEQHTVSCGATIGPDEPTNYDGVYERDDDFPSKDGNGKK